MKVIILTGGLGTRLSEETESKPKPMVLIGKNPILWHLMNIFSRQGLNDFVLALGYKGEVIKRWIQDNDVCQTYLGAESAHPIGPNLGDYANPRRRYCDNSWSFKMLDATTRLAPRFKMPYFAGAITLSVITEDYDGAKEIFERGIKTYPDDWELLYRASYHFLFDRGDLPRAAELLSRAGKLGAPYWLNLLAARLYSKAGQIELGINSLVTFKATIKDNPKQVEAIEKRIRELRTQLALAGKKEP